MGSDEVIQDNFEVILDHFDPDPQLCVKGYVKGLLREVRGLCQGSWPKGVWPKGVGRKGLAERGLGRKGPGRKGSLAERGLPRKEFAHPIIHYLGVSVYMNIPWRR